MAGNAGLLIVTAALAAALAATRDQPKLYRAMLHGTITAQWNYTTAPADADGCTSNGSEIGTRVVAFRMGAPASVRVRDGRLAGRELEPLVGTTTTTGNALRSQTCGDAETQETHLDCIRTVQTFSRAHVRLATRPRSIALGALQRAFIGQALSCPGAPPAGELGRVPQLGSVRVSLPRVLRSTTVRIPGGFDETLDLSGGVSGQLTWKIAWTLTLQRVQP